MPNEETKPTGTNTPTIPEPLPPWIENDYLFQQLPPNQQQVVLNIINPVYQQLVLETADPFEQTTAISVVYLLYNELLTQSQIGTSALDDDMPDVEREMCMEEFLDLLEPKQKMSWLLLRVRQHIQENQEPPIPEFPLPAAALESTTTN